MAKLQITHPLGTKDRVLYNTQATVSGWCYVTFEDDDGNPAEWTGSPTTIDAGGDIGEIEIYEDVDGESALGKYIIDASSWKFFGPDGPQRTLSDAGLGEVDGDPPNPKKFQPVTPGRWLIRVQGHLIEQEALTGNGYCVASSEITSFTALLEVEDPHVIGNIDGGHLETASESIGTSFIAPTEEVEYDADEGWSRSAERYFSTISKGMGFRKIATGSVHGGAVSFGTLLTLVDTEEYSRWKDSLVGTDSVDGGDEVYYYNYVVKVRPIEAADLSSSSLFDLPIFVCLGTSTDAGDRVYMLVEGTLPYDTTAVPTIDPSTGNNSRLFIQSTAVLGSTPPSTLGLGYLDRYVGHVILGNTADDADTPGAIYFHGHSTWLPGVVQGPLSSTDKAVVRWDGTTGELIQDSALKVDHLDAGEASTDAYTDIASVVIQTVNHSDAANPSDTSLKITTPRSLTRAPGGITIVPGDGVNPADTRVISGLGETAGGALELSSGNANAAGVAGSASGNIAVTTPDCHTAGNIVISSGGAQADGASVSVSAGYSEAGVGGPLTLSGGDANDGDGVGAIGGDVTISAGRGNPGGSVYIDGGPKNDPASLNGDVLLANNVGKVGIGGPAPDDADSEVVLVTGDSKFEGNLHITQKLTVDGLIDPIGLILTSHVDDLAGALAANEGALFVAEGGGSTDHLGNPLTSGELYYKYQQGFDGVDEKVVSISTGAGLSIPGPLASSTYAHAIAKWADDQGATLENSNVLVDSEAGPFTSEYVDFGSLSTVSGGTTRTIDGTAYTTSPPLLIATGTAAPASGESAGSIKLHPGISDAAPSGNLFLFAGHSRVGGANAGVVDILGGQIVPTGGPDDFVYSGGDVTVIGGRHEAGTTPSAIDPDRRGTGGSAKLLGGDGNDGGAVVIRGGNSWDNVASTYANGWGGSLSLSGGLAGLDITGTHGAPEPGVTHVALRGGDVNIKGGDTQNAPAGDPADPTWTVQGPSGGDIQLVAGDAGIGTGADIGGDLVRAHSGGGAASEEDIQLFNQGNHRFHGRGGSVRIASGKGDHTGGSGSITIETQHSNLGWDAGSGAPDYDAGLGYDPTAAQGSIGKILIKGADSVSVPSSGVAGGEVELRAGSAGNRTSGEGGHVTIWPGEPDWPTHTVDTTGDGVPDTELVQTGPDAQDWDAGVGAVVDTPWPVNLAAVPPEAIGPLPGAISLDPQARGVVMVGTMDFHRSDHLCLASSVPRMVVDGDMVCTGIIDPKGLELKPSTENPGNAAVIANGGVVTDFESTLKNVLWVRDPDGALMLGDNVITAAGSAVSNPENAIAGDVPILGADGTLSAPGADDPKISTGATGVSVAGSMRVTYKHEQPNGTFSPKLTYDSSYAEHVTEDRTDANGNVVGTDYVVPVGDTDHIVLVDITTVVMADQGVDFDFNADWPNGVPASTARLVVQLPDAAANTGRRIVVKDAKGFSNLGGEYPMIVVRADRSAGAQFIDDIPSVPPDTTTPDAALLPEPWSSMTLLCDGSQWFII